MNQRAHIRQEVKMPAVVSSGHFRERSCRVENFCLGGVLLSVPAEEVSFMAAMQEGEPLTLGVDVRGRQSTRRVDLPGKVVRKEANALGVAFAGPAATDLLAVQNHVRGLLEEHHAPVPQSAGRDRERGRQAAATVRALIDEFCTAGLERFHAGVREALREQVNALDSDAEREPFVESLSVLQASRAPLARNFVENAVAPLDRLAAGVDHPAPEDGPGGSAESRLSLVDKDAFEDWLTLKVMASRAEVHLQQELLYLQLRFDELFGIELDPRRNPLSPTVLCNAFGESLRLLPLKEKTERVILAVFEDQVVSDLSRFYRKVNEQLEREGVLPRLDIGRYLSERYGRPLAEQTLRAYGRGKDADELGGAGDKVALRDRTTAGRSAEGPEVSRGSSVLQQYIARNAYDTIRRLLTSGTGQGVEAEGASGPRPENAQVEAALNGLQSSAEPDSDPLPRQVEEALRAQMGGPVSPGPELRTAMNVIHHLFDGILEDPLIAEEPRRSIRQLQVPFLRLMLVDDSFLSDREHPARKMLNCMARLGLRDNAALESKEAAIAEQVDHVLGHFDGNIAIFFSVLERLEPLLQRGEKLFEHNVQRVAEACEGRERLAAARRTVNESLERIAGGQRAPRALLSLIDAGWRELLTQTLLRKGGASEEWERYLFIPQRLMEAADQPPDMEQLQGLLAVIKEGLARVDDTQLQNARLIGELRDLLSRKARDKTDPPLVDVPPGLLARSDEDSGEEEGEQDRASTERRWHRRLERYECGDWFSFREEGEEMPVRLAWIGFEGATWVFVNHKGMKVSEYTRAELAAELARGRLRPTDSHDAPPVDRGLEAMVRGIYEQMARQAARDDLTGLASRREFERRLRQRLEAGERDGSLLHLDIDRFELINNQGGPDAGDELLCAIAELLRDEFPGRMMARLGGDEFAVWLDGTDSTRATALADGLCRRAGEERFHCGGRAHQITISCGIASCSSGARSGAELMRAADSACHAAKEAGRNRVEGGSREGDELARRDDLMGWVTRLNEAMEEGRLSLRAQRIEPTRVDDSPPAFEVLLSLHTEDGEELPPGEFMRAAEQYNRMHVLDRWVIENVLAWMHRHSDVVQQIDHLAINLSGHSLNDDTLLEFIFERLTEYPVPRERLCFEVTETATIARIDDAMDFIQAIRELGCRFSLDDFGAGQASYAHLRALPVDYIKIDGSFIRDVATDRTTLAMVRSMNEMGHLMGKQTVAEFVENARIRELLLELGVDFVQGYGVEKPRPLETLRDL